MKGRCDSLSTALFLAMCSWSLMSMKGVVKSKGVGLPAYLSGRVWTCRWNWPSCALCALVLFRQDPLLLRVRTYHETIKLSSASLLQFTVSVSHPSMSVPRSDKWTLLFSRAMFSLPRTHDSPQQLLLNEGLISARSPGWLKFLLTRPSPP